MFGYYSVKIFVVVLFNRIIIMSRERKSTSRRFGDRHVTALM
jgi:hypothetical protein